jgi:hypothetical protein
MPQREENLNVTLKSDVTFSINKKMRTNRKNIIRIRIIIRIIINEQPPILIYMCILKLNLFYDAGKFIPVKASIFTSK